MKENPIGMMLRLAYLNFHRQAQAHFSEFNITADQFVILNLLAKESHVTQRDLVDRSGSDSSTIAAIMKILEKNSWIIRKRDPNDGRAYVISLTSKGKELNETLTSSVTPFRNALQKCIPKEERSKFIEHLEMISKFKF